MSELQCAWIFSWQREVLHFTRDGLAFVLAVPAGIVLIFLKVWLLGAF